MTNAGFMVARMDWGLQVTNTDTETGAFIWPNVWVQGQTRDHWARKTGVGFCESFIKKYHPCTASSSSLCRAPLPTPLHSTLLFLPSVLLSV